MYKTEGLIETHFHGAFGVDFMDCSEDEVIEVAKRLTDLGITRIYPTLMTGDIQQIKRQIAVIKNAAINQPKDIATISGIHLEGPFINPLKKGIHQQEYILKPSIENYKKIEDDFIKIVTIAPEMDENRELSKYLKSKNILVQAGHTMAEDVWECDGCTHFFNAMAALSHKYKNIISAALTNEKIQIELIADGNHVIDDVLKMVFKAKSRDKISLISDALPIAHAFNKGIFAGQQVVLNNGGFYSESGTLAGSGMLLPEILKRIVNSGMLTFEEAVYMMNISPQHYLNVRNNAFVTFDDNLDVCKVDFV
jgi:N-acetylglucosamine-6-phosphate deacetylase